MSVQIQSQFCFLLTKEIVYLLGNQHILWWLLHALVPHKICMHSVSLASHTQPTAAWITFSITHAECWKYSVVWLVCETSIWCLCPAVTLPEPLVLGIEWAAVFLSVHSLVPRPFLKIKAWYLLFSHACTWCDVVCVYCRIFNSTLDFQGRQTWNTSR